MFPSPCGVMDLKAVVGGAVLLADMFPSPCGVMDLKVNDIVTWEKDGDTFPSPCGVMDLKDIVHHLVIAMARCFRPLAG